MNAKQALVKLRKAQGLAARAEGFEVRAACARATQRGTYSVAEKKSESCAEQAHALFLEVEGYLERLT